MIFEILFLAKRTLTSILDGNVERVDRALLKVQRVLEVREDAPSAGVHSERELLGGCWEGVAQPGIVSFVLVLDGEAGDQLPDGSVFENASLVKRLLTSGLIVGVEEVDGDVGEAELWRVSAVERHREERQAGVGFSEFF